MYESDIAMKLKVKIDNEMSNLINNTDLISLEQRIKEVKSKAELETVKEQLLSYNNYINSNRRTVEKPKVLVRVRKKEVGFVDLITISLIVVFTIGVAVGIGYMLFRFGV